MDTCPNDNDDNDDDYNDVYNSDVILMMLTTNDDYDDTLSERNCFTVFQNLLLSMKAKHIFSSASHRLPNLFPLNLIILYVNAKLSVIMTFFACQFLYLMNLSQGRR